MKIQEWMDQRGLALGDIIKITLAIGALSGFVGVMLYGMIGSWLI